MCKGIAPEGRDMQISMQIRTRSVRCGPEALHYLVGEGGGDERSAGTCRANTEDKGTRSA